MKPTPGETCTLPVTAHVQPPVDVLIAGGGTAGVVAAIAAARGGAKVRLVERSHLLGGMMTGGNCGLTLFTVYDKREDEYREIISQLREPGGTPGAVHIAGGIPMEITRRLLDTGAAVGTAGTAGSYVITSQVEFAHLLATMMQESGVEVLLHSLIVDVIKGGEAVSAVVVENKSGRQVLPAQVFVDATGDGDVAAKAGVPFVVGVGEGEPCAVDGMPVGSMHEMGVMFRMGNVDFERLFAHLREHPGGREQFTVQSVAQQSLEEAYDSIRNGEMATFEVRVGETLHHFYNSPLPGVVTLGCPCYDGDGLDADDLTRGQLALFERVREQAEQLREHLPGFEDSYVLELPPIGVRETRHIQGDYVLTIEDILARKSYPDTIGRGSHPIDAGKLPDDLKAAATEDHWYFEIPYRCLIARGIDNLLVAGRCISATHEASGCTRPTVQCMITGQAAGAAAAMSASRGVTPRELDPGALCAQLARDGVVL